MVLGFIIKKLFEKPAILLYRQLLKAQFRLAALGIEIKNPFVYALSSKTLGYLVLIGLSAFVIVGDIISQEQDADFFEPKSIIARLVVSEEDQVFMEEFDTSAPTSDATPLTGVKAPTPAGENIPEEEISKEPGDVSLGSGTLLKPVIPSTTEGTTAPDAIRTYVVQDGDSIGLIAQKFGINTSTLIWANGLNKDAAIRPGQRLTILPTDGILYRIKKGDSLSKITSQFGSDSDRIIAFNKLSGPTDINIGEQIIIPGGAPTPSQLATPSQPTSGRTPSTSTKTKNQPIPAVISKSAGMVWPTTQTRINQYFSWRHTGVDIAGKIGNPIYAASSGTVVISAGGYNGGYGNTIVIDHGNGVRTRYGHASKLLVSVGEHVSKGEAIALLGSTGRSTGPHLHFEVLTNGKKVNPLGYVRQ